MHSQPVEYDWRAELKSLRESGLLFNYEDFLLDLAEADFQFDAGKITEAEHKRITEELWMGSPNRHAFPNQAALHRVIGAMQKEGEELRNRRSPGIV